MTEVPEDRAAEERTLGGPGLAPLTREASIAGRAWPDQRQMPGRPRSDVRRIEEASRVIDEAFVRTPQFVSDELGRATEAEVIVKIELLNPVRSFKGRGADYFLRTWAEPTGRPLVCASAGNFGLAMAYVARRRKVKLVVVAAETANPVKVRAIRNMGAEVRLHGVDYDAAKVRAKEAASEIDGVFVEDGVEPAITEGAGTIGVELASRLPVFDDVVLPVGGGALATGVGRYLKATRPDVKIVGVCASGAPAMALAWHTGRPEATGPVDTIADGIAIRVPEPGAVARTRAWVDEMLLVDDEAMLEAMGLLVDVHGVVVEPAGAAGLAALLAHRQRFSGRTVVVPLCGGNIDPALIPDLLARSARTGTTEDGWVEDVR